MRTLIHTIGNMVKIPPKESMCKHSSSDSIIFVGKMSYEPNIVAVTYFSREILPKLRNSFLDLSFTIVGANPGSNIYALEGIDGVHVTGFVESVEPYFQKATVVVAPMLTGAGIQNKIIQAMSYGCCVATTATGAEGLTIKNNEICIFNTTEEWISGLKMLLKDTTKRIEMGAEARKYIIDNLSPEVIGKQFETFIKSTRLFS